MATPKKSKNPTIGTESTKTFPSDRRAEIFHKQLMLLTEWFGCVYFEYNVESEIGVHIIASIDCDWFDNRDTRATGKDAIDALDNLVTHLERKFRGMGESLAGRRQ